MAGRPGPLLGRDGELAALRTALDDTSTGEGRVAMVAGDAGIGKSRLLEELADAARAAGFLTFVGRAAEFEADVPFAVLIDAIDSFLRTLDPRDVDRLSADRLGALAAVFPALAGLGSSVDVPVNAGERFRVHRAASELLERLAARQPVLLVLDDLQWSDAASLELAAHLARRPPDGAVMVAFGVRTGGVTEHTERALASIEATEHVISLTLRPLERAALAELVGSVDPRESDRWYELTRGNPFFAIQLARAGLGPGLDHTSDDVPGDVPGAVQRAIRLEFDALPALAREVATAAAVVGDPFDLDLVITASEVTEDAVLDGLDHLCLQGLVRATPAPRIFEFRHPLVRSAIYRVTPPGKRIARHRRIAQRLNERGAGPVELARHVEHSARYGDRRAIDVLGRAAEAVLAQAPISAARWLTAALALLPASEPPRKRIRLLGHLANAHAAVGDLNSGLTALHHSLSIIPPDDARALANVAIGCSEGERLLGRADQATATLRAAYEKLRDRSSPEAARIAVARSATAFYLGAYDDTLKWADEAVRVAERLDDDGLLVAARSAQLAGAAFSGSIAGARQLHAQLGPELDRLDDTELGRQLDALGALSIAEMYLDLYEAAYAHATRGLSIARATGRTHLLPLFTPVAGTAAWTSGHIDTAIAVLDDAIDAARLLENNAVLAWHLYNRALPELVLGDVEHADTLTGESWALAEPLPDGMIRGLAAAGRAMALHDRGEPSLALDLLYRHAGGPELTLLAGGLRGLWLEVATRCHLELGDLDGAIAAANRARALAEEAPVDMAAMSADRAEAFVAVATEQTERAIVLLRSAHDRAASMRSPVYVAWCHELLGFALEAAGDRAGAVSELTIASEMSNDLGTIRHRDRLDAELRRLGQTIHRRTRTGTRGGVGPEALTGREREVAELVRAHATNREIANELFLSQKTVETHIRNIFNKLGVSSRRGIARALDTEHRS